jgi:hypothetical protein
MAQKPNSGLSRLIFEVSGSHTIRQTQTYPVGPLWTSDHLIAEAGSYITHNKHSRRIFMPTELFEPRDTIYQGATHRHSRQHGLLDRRINLIGTINYSVRPIKIKVILILYQYYLNNNLLVSAQAGRHHAIYMDIRGYLLPIICSLL